MKKYTLLLISCLAFSQLSHAENNLTSRINSELQKHHSQTASYSGNAHSSLIYGGQDISRPRVASADMTVRPTVSTVNIV